MKRLVAVEEGLGRFPRKSWVVSVCMSVCASECSL